MPSTVDYADLRALLIHQPGVAERAYRFLLASRFNVIHTATLGLPRPLGTGIPHPPVYALANFDPTHIAASIGAELLGDPNEPLQYPTVNRKDKGDRLNARARAPLPPLPPALPIKPVANRQIGTPPASGEATGRFAPGVKDELASLPDEQTASDAVRPRSDLVPEKPIAARPMSKSAARVYFGVAPIAAGGGMESIRPWAAGQAPVVQSASLDAGLTTHQPSTMSGGESIAVKGEVSGLDQCPTTPAERLALKGRARAKAIKCLADAVYFEARGEPVRGQIAVAQVVMNRVFSPFYPNDVCRVVYQNADRRDACQFTFACDGVPEVVTEPDAWVRARRIAADMLDGKLWLPAVGKSTHYHATWVHPDWVAEMNRIDHIGTHIFYRPRAWGNGADLPSWSNPKTTARETKIIKKMEPRE
jgi:spore germination cell wall hydrolase CwlJ-like protein